MAEPTFDGNGNLHLGPYSRISKARQTVDFDPHEVDGVALDVAPNPSASNERAGLKLGDFYIGQDTAKSNTKNFGILDANGVLIWSLTQGVPASGMPTAVSVSDAGATPLTLSAADIAGAESVFLNLTAALGGAGTATTPAAAAIIAAIPGGAVGMSYQWRVINSSAGAFAWTIAAGASVTLNGTMSVAQNTFRDFVVLITGAATVSITNVGTGTWS